MPDEGRVIGTNSTSGQYLLMLCAGVALGFVIGLSEAPVVQGVVTSLLALVITLASVLSGISKDQPPTQLRISVAFVAWLVIGIGAGAPGGVYVREFGFLAPQVKPQPAKSAKNPADQTDTPSTGVRPAGLKTAIALSDGQLRKLESAKEGDPLYNALKETNDSRVQRILKPMEAHKPFTPENEAQMAALKDLILEPGGGN